MTSPGLRHPARAAGTSLLRLQSDERLAELASSGHESAFDAIVDRYRTPLTRYCAGIVGPSRAEDAAQQALINAHDALQRTDEVRNLRSWLYRIAHNAALNVLRAVRDDVPLDEQTLHAPRGGAGARVAAAAGPEESFERSEQFRSTLAALQALPERQRAALVLRELEGRSHEEIAAALGVTKGSARQHLMRARVAVRSAVTAVTPYPLVARLAEWTSASAGAPGWAEGAATAGAGASLAKLTAGLAATGALVGGAVGTEHVVRGGAKAGSAAPPTAEGAAQRIVKPAGGAVAIPATTVTRSGAASGPTRGAKREEASRRSSSSAAAKRGVRRATPPKKRAIAPAAASEPAASTSAPLTSPEDSRADVSAPSAGRRSEKKGKGHDKSAHGRETSQSHRSENAGGSGSGDKQAAKDEKHASKKEDKSEPPGQAKKTAPSTSEPSSSAEGSDGKGPKDKEPKGNSDASGSHGSSDPGSASDETPAGKTTGSASPTTSDDEG